MTDYILESVLPLSSQNAFLSCDIDYAEVVGHFREAHGKPLTECIFRIARPQWLEKVKKCFDDRDRPFPVRNYSFVEMKDLRIGSGWQSVPVFEIMF